MTLNEGISKGLSYKQLKAKIIIVLLLKLLPFDVNATLILSSGMNDSIDVNLSIPPV